MKTLTTLVVALSLSVLSGCESANKTSMDLRAPTEKQVAGTPQSRPAADAARGSGFASGLVAAQGQRETLVSLEGAAAVQAATLAADRKIIRNADLTIETDSPTDGLRK